MVFFCLDLLPFSPFGKKSFLCVYTQQTDRQTDRQTNRDIINSSRLLAANKQKWWCSCMWSLMFTGHKEAKSFTKPIVWLSCKHQVIVNCLLSKNRCMKQVTFSPYNYWDLSQCFWRFVPDVRIKILQYRMGKLTALHQTPIAVLRWLLLREGRWKLVYFRMKINLQLSVFMQQNLSEVLRAT